MKIAVIGTGISGNAASWLLHKNHDITVYERYDTPGGHARTVMLDGHPPIDVGFTLFNQWTSPNFTDLLKTLDVSTAQAGFSFGFSLDGGNLEYAMHNHFAQKKNKLSPPFLAMIKDIRRFYTSAPKYLDSKEPNMPLGVYLKKHGYSQNFVKNHLLPMAACLWSVGAGSFLKMPARAFIRVVKSNRLFIKNAPDWLSVEGGSSTYVDKMVEPFRDKILFGTAAVSVYRRAEGVEVADSRGNIGLYDAIVMACHTDQALRLIQDATDQEKEILKHIPYVLNKAYLHQDESLMPGLKSVWSAWNYFHSNKDGQACVTHWLNKMQMHLGTAQNYFLTLNPPVEPQHVLKEMTFYTPALNGNAMKLWRDLRKIQGRLRTWYCGAWCGYGFHEDGLSAGLRVAESIGPDMRPWQVKESSPAGTYAAPEKDG